MFSKSSETVEYNLVYQLMNLFQLKKIYTDNKSLTHYISLISVIINLLISAIY